MDEDGLITKECSEEMRQRVSLEVMIGEILVK
jgi:hypothetical protein